MHNESKSKGMGKVLIMDDERIVRETIGMLLCLRGYTAMAAKEGVGALAMFRRAGEEGNPFDAAILDLVIERGMDGKETAIELRKLNPVMPILVVSAYSHDPVMAAPREYLFTDSLCKPFQSAVLIAKLEYYLHLTGKGMAG